ncbi:MAG: hypothetical protein C5B51_21960, partial [Terriglobia bacterium]
MYFAACTLPLKSQDLPGDAGATDAVAQSATIIVTVSPSPAGLAQPLTVKVVATGPAGTPTGTLHLAADRNLIGNLIPLTGGSVTFTIPDAAYGIPDPSALGLDLGRHTIGVDYSGDVNYASQRPLANEVPLVVEHASSTSVSVSVNPAVYGQGVTYTAVVNVAAAPGDAETRVPSGDVVFFDNGTPLNASPMPLIGNYVQFTPPLPLATASHSITAAYLGDRTTAGSISAPATLLVMPALTVTAVSTPGNNGSSVFGQPIGLSASVAVQAPGSGTPAGTVQFLDGRNVIASAALVSGTGATTLANYPAGAHSFTARYSGDTNYAPSTSTGSVSFGVNKASTTVAKPTMSAISRPGQTVTFSAAVGVTPPGSGSPSGTISFKDGATLIGSGTVTAGIASLTLSTLAAGGHGIVAVYNGDSSFSASNPSDPLNFVIPQNATSVTLAASANPAVYGQPVTYTATVTAGATGTVNFFDNGVPLNSAPIPLSGSQAQLASATLAVGSHQITAVYSGDATFNGATGSLAAGVNKAATSASPPSVSGSPVIGQALTVAASVSVLAPGSGTPTGSISFSDGGNLLGTAALGAGGIASIATSSLAKGPHSITAVYNGDGNFAASGVSGVTAIAVDPKPSAVQVSGAANTLVYGQAVSFTATVTAGATGTVNFFDNGAMLNSTPVPLSGSQAQFTPTAPLGAGNHGITAVYVGDANYASAASSAWNLAVSKANTAITLKPAQDGLSITFTAAVSVTAPGAGIPSGTVQLVNAGASVGVTPLSALQAILTTVSIFGDFTAVYSGDNNFNGSTSPVVNVARPQVTLTLSANINPAIVGQTITLTAPLKVVAGNGIPTGSVQFLDGAAPIGSATVSGASASLDAPVSTAGPHAILAKYSGDAVFGPASAALDLTVNRMATSLSISAPAGDIPAGQPVTLTVQLGPAAPASVAGPTGDITFLEGGKALGTVSISSAGAALTVNNFDPGPHQVEARYAGDQNWAAATGSATVSIKRAAITITTSSLPDGALGAPYSASLSATGGAPPYQWSIEGLPQGLNADVAGTISGTPTADGSFSAKVQVHDRNNTAATATLALSIAVRPLSITTASLPDARPGTAYSATLSASGGVPPYTWRLATSDTDEFAVSGDGAVSGRPASPGSFRL